MILPLRLYRLVMSMVMSGLRGDHDSIVAPRVILGHRFLLILLRAVGESIILHDDPLDPRRARSRSREAAPAGADAPEGRGNPPGRSLGLLDMESENEGAESVHSSSRIRSLPFIPSILRVRARFLSLDIV